jgi:hypothetical protein
MGLILSHSRDLAFGLLLLATVSAMAEDGAPVPPQADAPNALTTLLPHQKGRAFCYVSNQAPVTYRLEDFPARKTPRTLAIQRFIFELSSNRHDDEATNPPTPGNFYDGFRMIGEVVGTKRRRLIAAGDCGSGSMKGFGCGADCAGGAAHFEPLAGTDSLAMRVNEDAGRFRMSWGCGGDEDKSEVLLYDKATPAIRLDNADPKVCKPMDNVFKTKD